MNIELSPEAAQFVKSLVAAGQFQSEDDAIAAGVRLLMSQHALRAEIQRGVDELDAGRGINGDIVFAELRERARKLMESAE